jgi:hypothetical protein
MGGSTQESLRYDSEILKVGTNSDVGARPTTMLEVGFLIPRKTEVSIVGRLGR